MNNTKILQYLSIIALIFIMCSGIYGIIIGIHYTNEYLRLTEELGTQSGVTITAFSLILNYFSGAFRGIVTLACGMIGLVNIRKQQVKTGYLVFLGILSSFYFRAERISICGRVPSNVGSSILLWNVEHL